MSPYKNPLKMQLAYFQVFIPTCLLLLIGTPAHVEPAKILFLIPMSTRSEKHMFSPLITKLASNGHNLTVVTNIADKVGHANVTEIVPISVDEVCGSVSDIGASQSLFWDIVFLDMKPLMSLVDKIYDHPEFKTVLRQKFDLIFTNLFFGQAFYGVMYKNRGPFILLHSLPVANYFLKDWGHVAPPSHVPYPLLEFTDKMNFRERVVNFLVDWATYFHSEMVDIPLFEEVYRKHLGREVPSVKEIQKNASLMMMNTNYLTTYHRPVMPDVIEIGGMHCKEAKPLPEDLEKLVGTAAAPDGFIFISFGTVLTGSSLPEGIKDKFLHVFSRLKQKILWKWESEDGDNLPSNVIRRKWLPQQDILGHSNIRLFISHGGLLSMQQTIYHGVPVITFPFFFDQMTNARAIEDQGVGLNMNVWNFTETKLEEGINQIIVEGSKFKRRAQLLSKVSKDVMNSPLERAVFWTEHVLKFDGAPHLRSSARELNFLQLHSIDVVLFLVGVLYVGIYILVSCLKMIIKYCNNNRKDNNKQKKL